MWHCSTRKCARLCIQNRPASSAETPGPGQSQGLEPDAVGAAGCPGHRRNRRDLGQSSGQFHRCVSVVPLPQAACESRQTVLSTKPDRSTACRCCPGSRHGPPPRPCKAERSTACQCCETVRPPTQRREHATGLKRDWSPRAPESPPLPTSPPANPSSSRPEALSSTRPPTRSRKANDCACRRRSKRDKAPAGTASCSEVRVRRIVPSLETSLTSRKRFHW